MGCFQTYRGKHYSNEAEIRRVIARELFKEYNAIAETEYGTDEHLEGFKNYIASKAKPSIKKDSELQVPTVEVSDDSVTVEQIISKYLQPANAAFTQYVNANPVKRNAEAKFTSTDNNVVEVQTVKVADIDGFSFYAYRTPGNKYVVIEETTGAKITEVDNTKVAEEQVKEFLSGKEGWADFIKTVIKKGTALTRMNAEIAAASPTIEEDIEVPKGNVDLLNKFFKRVKRPKKVTVYRTEGTGLNNLNVAHRGTGTYYAIDRPFLTGKKGEKVTSVEVSIPEGTTLDITSHQESGIHNIDSLEYDKIWKEATRRTNEVKKQELNTFPNMLKNVALERGYTGVISYIEPGAPDISSMREIGREYVEYGQVEYGETGIREKIYKILPKDIAVKLVDDYVDIFNNGDVALGMFRESMITLSKHASDKVMYHEAFHAIFMTMLSPKQRAAIIQEASEIIAPPTADRLSKLMSEKNINVHQAMELHYHEAIADEFEEFKADPKNYRFNKREGLKAFFDRIVSWIKSVFTNTHTIDQLFSNINRGKYTNSKVNVYTDITLHKRHPEFSQSEIKDIVAQLAYALVEDVNIVNTKKFDLSTNVEFIDELIKALHTRAETNGDLEQVNRTKKVYKNRKFFKSEVRKYLNSFGVTEDDVVTDEDGNIVASNKLTLDSFDTATASTRLLIALTPMYKNYVNKEFYTKGSYLGLPKFVNITDTWNFIMRNLKDVYSFNPEVDTFDAIVDRLRELQHVRPEMGAIADKISQSGEQAKTQFTIALVNMNLNYVTTLVKVKDAKYNIRVVSSEVESDPKIVTNQWNEELLEKATDKDAKGIYYRKDYVASVGKGLDKFTDLLNEDIAKDKLSEGTLDMLNKLLGAIGVTVDPRALSLAMLEQEQKSDVLALNNMLYDKETGIIKGITQLTRLGGEYVDKFETADGTTVDQTVILDQKAFLKLAEYEAMFATDTAKVTHVGPDGSIYYGFAKHTAKAKMIEQYNKNRGSLDPILSKPYGVNSRFAKWLKASDNNRLKLHSPLTFKEENAKDKGDKISNLNPINNLINSINTTLSGYYIGLAEAGKANQYYVSGPKMVEARAGVHLTDLEHLNYNLANLRDDLYLEGEEDNEVVDILLDYLSDELGRMRKTHIELYGNSDLLETEDALPEDKLIAFYHYENTPGDKKGKGLKNHLFPGMDLKKYNLISSTGAVKVIGPNTLHGNVEIRRYVYDTFLDIVNGQVQNAVDAGIVTSLMGASISEEVLSNYERNYKVIGAMADYTINSMIASLEDTKLFIGDPASYEEKRGDIYGDITKRVPANSLQGNSARVYKNKETGEWEVRPFYWSATINDIEKPSAAFLNSKGNLDQKVVDNVYRALAVIDGKKLMTKKEVKRLLSAYVENINLVDAAAYITMSARRERAKGFGRWDETRDQEVYDRITNNEMLPEDLNWMLSPMKTGHGELSTRTGIVQEYNKQAEFTLHPYLTKGTRLDNLRIAMENYKNEKGELQPLDHVLFISGKKSGGTGVTTIVDENNELLPVEDIKFTPVQLSYYFLVEQLPSSEKGDVPTNVGTQMRKTVMVNADLEGEYNINKWDQKTQKHVPTPVKGKDLVQLHYDVTSKLSNMGINKLFKRLNYNPDIGFQSVDPATGNFYVNNNSKESLYRALEEEFEGEVSDNVIEALNARDPLDSIIGMGRKIENKISSMVNKATVKLKQKGAALVQMPDFGLTGLDISTEELHKSTLWFKDPVEELKMANLTREGDVLTYNRSQVILSRSIVKDIPGWQNMGASQIKKAIDPEILKGIMYRIPTQGSSSLDSFDIVGILPEGMGDVMISYFEITAKTGSDFDIDKVFVMYYNYKPTYDNRGMFLQIGKEFGLESEIDKDAVDENEYLEWLVEQSKTSMTVSEKKFRTSPEGYRKKNLSIVAERTYKQALATLKEQRTDKQIELIERVDEIRDSFFIRLSKINYNPNNETKAGLENYSLDIIRALIEDPKSYIQTIAALDNDWLPKYSNELFPARTDLLPGQFWTGGHQAYLKQLYDASKDLVGVIANHISDHGPSQIAELYFRTAYLGRGNNKDGYSSLSGITNENKIIISAILADYMNGIVDADKDPYITRANLNNFTASIAFALARAGVHEKFVVALIGQPILFDVVKENYIQNSFVNADLYSKGRMMNAYTRAAKKYDNSITDIEEYESSIVNLSDITIEELENQIKNPTKDFQLGVLKLFKNTKEHFAKPLNDSIKASKFDTVGAGKNLTSSSVMIEVMTKAINDNIIGNLHKKLGIEVDALNNVVYDAQGFPKATKKTFLSTFYNNSAKLSKQVFGSLFVSESKAFKEVVSIIAHNQNPNILLDEDAIDSIKRELFAYVISHEDSKFNPSKERMVEMLFGNNTTGKKLKAVKRLGGDISENLLIQKLMVEESENVNTPDFVRLNRSKQFSLETEKDFFISFEELLKISPAYAKELAQMSYISSGFIHNFGSFYDVISNTYLRKEGFGKFIEESANNFKRSGELTSGVRQIIQHLPLPTENNAIVPKVLALDKGPIDMSTKDKLILSDTAELFTLIGSKFELKRYILGVSIGDNVEFIRYLQSPKSDRLYELVGYNKNLPIYKQISKLGYRERGRIVKEYSYGTNKNSSIFNKNNVSLSAESTAVLNNVLQRETFRDIETVETFGNEYYVNPVITQEQIDEAKKPCE